MTCKHFNVTIKNCLHMIYMPYFVNYFLLMKCENLVPGLKNNNLYPSKKKLIALKKITTLASPFVPECVYTNVNIYTFMLLFQKVLPPKGIPFTQKQKKNKNTKPT